MTKHILFIFLLVAFTGNFVKAQSNPFAKGPVSHSQWKLSSKKISDCEYDLIFTVSLDKGWHTYSVVKIKGAELEVFPTSIILKSNKEYTLVGDLTETKPVAEYDKTIKKTVLLHYNKVVFTQRVKLNSGSNVKISGTYQNQVCNDVCETPPYEEFDFNLQGTSTCKK